jgi:Zn-dependent protease
VPPLYQLLAIGLTIFTAIGIHEYCHAKFADLAGDPTPGYFGRVTLNLTKHFELMGTIMIVITSLAGIGIGWGKPVPMDPSKMKNPRWDHFIAVAVGPASNFIQAAVFALLIRASIVISPEFEGAFSAMITYQSTIDPLETYGFFFAFMAAWFQTAVVINIALCLFNLLPIGPLDGMWLLGTFMSPRTRLQWTRFNLTVGGFIFIGIVLFSQMSDFKIISRVIGPPLHAIVKFLTGI